MSPSSYHPAGYTTPSFAVKDFTEFAHQGLFGERLLDEIDPFVQDAVVHNGVTRISRHIDNPHLRMRGPEPASQVSSIHPRHDHVCEKKMDWRRVLFYQFEEFGNALSREHRIAISGQKLTGKLPHSFSILGQQNC